MCFNCSGYLHDCCVGSSIERDVVHLGDEDGSDGDEESRAIHVHRGSDGEDELGDARVDLVLILHATEVYWEGGRPVTFGN